MINFIKRLFSNKNNQDNLKKEIDSYSYECLFAKFLDDELDRVDYFLLDKKEIILKHFKREIDLNKSDNYLTKEEKEKIGIDKQIRVTKDLIQIFNLLKIKGEDPKQLLSELYYRIHFKISKIKELEKLKYLGLNKVLLKSSKDERTCKWCLDIEKEIIDITEVDLIKLIDNNCKCKYNRSLISAKISIIN
ncbi:hypothetical protein [Aliarcobacter butzleri]|uniref:hypothetical protein n=1 Tax=Aliarcobacter butzleri TaxID=28197 RepID=UPI0021B2DC9F|nr:hypothetical protein [Aliarcobacter butzleri]MCT7601280.1 hypothetical protein [Aliarcobacter butzleri]